MTIQAILKNKGAEVVAIDAAHPVAEAVRIMDKRQIGALVVAGQGEDCSGISPSATSCARWPAMARIFSTSRWPNI